MKNTCKKLRHFTLFSFKKIQGLPLSYMKKFSLQGDIVLSGTLQTLPVPGGSLKLQLRISLSSF